MEDLVVDVGVVEEGLGGDTSNVQAGSSESSALLNASSLDTWVSYLAPQELFGVAKAHLQSLLGGLDGSDVSTGSSTYV
jgi:hypothetical protein